MNHMNLGWPLESTIKKRIITNILVSNTHISCTKTENITSEMCFVLMFRSDILGTSLEHHPPTSLSHLYKTSLGSFFKNLKL